MSVKSAEQIADAVLYEGYVLYPYRVSSTKNQLRWQVGLIAPREFAESVRSDPWFTQTECLAETGAHAALTVRVRALRVQERAIEERVHRDGEFEWQPVDRLVVAGQPLVPWEEAIACEWVREDLPLDASSSSSSWEWTLESGCEVEPVEDAGAAAARIVRRREPLRIRLCLSAEPCGPVVKIRLRVENLTPCTIRTLEGRNRALRQSLAGTHAILRIQRGAFVSLLDPPAALAPIAAACENEQTFPVLAGTAGSGEVLLSSPIILYDYPAVAPESSGDLFDATEIDELLTLRVRTLTDDEKREARATDAHAARIVERCDAAAPEAIAKLHGAMRDPAAFLNPAGEPSPDAASADVAGVRVGRGSAVRLQPLRIADSMDICLRGRTATVAAVYRTLEGEPFVAVVLDDDPFGGEGAKYRRSLFFRPEEIQPLPRGDE